MSGVKRKFPFAEGDHDAPLASWSVEAVASFLLAFDALPEDVRTSCAAKAEEDHVDGETLASMAEAELGARAASAAVRRVPPTETERAATPQTQCWAWRSSAYAESSSCVSRRSRRAAAPQRRHREPLRVRR